YAYYVRESIEQVARISFREYVLVVVDVGSRDGSLSAVRAQLGEHPWMPATIVARGRNQGLSAARNCGIEHARGELIFILDADNQIYPHALERLVAELDRVPSASFAYGVIEAFAPDGPRDLVSW